MDTLKDEEGKELSVELVAAEPKFVLFSKTVWGVIIVALMMVAQYFGFDVGETADKAMQTFEKFGYLLAIVGLRTAAQPLAFTPPVSGGSSGAGGSGDSGLAETFNRFVMVGVIGMATALVFGLSSCSSGSYAPAGDFLRENPDILYRVIEAAVEQNGK